MVGLRRYFLPSVLALALAASVAATGQGATAPLTFTVTLVQQATYRHPHPPDGDAGDTFSTTQTLSAVGTALGFPNGRRVGTMQFTWGPLVSLSHGIVLPIQSGTGIFKGATGTVSVAPAGEHVDVFKLNLP